ncbi:hydrogenase 4 subunit B [Taklimakanibacter deserti]|uniref:hydrogenase 4 subunit B n=1 Tax=Taklimakanibacter deserti TaxID=2267839 RepID=UPI000E64887D
MNNVSVVLACVAALLVIALLAVLTRSRPSWASGLVYGGCFVICAIILVMAGGQLLDSAAPPAEMHLPVGLPWIGAHFRIDFLSAFFLVVINLGAALTSLYALGYGRHEQAPQRVLPFYAAFLAGMNLVLLSADAFSFLFAWEFMSLTSWALVMAHHRDSENRHAGYVYLVMASFGTLALLLAFGLLAGPAGGYAFADMRIAVHASWLPGLVLILVLLGAGSKSGLVPLHVWLPLAHPAAPSHVSALMSGVMTKVAIYGFVRIVFDLLGTPAWWWAIVVLIPAALSAVLGVLNAIVQRDLKRLLAYSTVENIGIIFIGLGLALAFEANGMAGLAALSFTAALFHALNHSLFKSLLFFGAGAVLNATGERSIEKLGGLIRRMPQTAFLFLGGCLAISALPPLNGFASEWLILQAILGSPNLPQWGLKLTIPAVGAMLALAAALSAACYVRAFGISFLGRPRSDAAAQAHETDRLSLTAMFVALGLCLLAGVLPGYVIDWLAPVARQIVGQSMPVQAAIPWLSIVPVEQSRSSYNGLLIFAFITFATLFTVQAIHRLASRATRRGPAWDCGFPLASPFTQYSGDSFAQPLRRVFGDVAFRAREKVTMPRPGDPRPARLEVSLRDILWETIYAPIAQGIGYAGEKFNALQFLTIRRYLSLVFGALVSLLLVVAIWS